MPAVNEPRQLIDRLHRGENLSRGEFRHSLAEALPEDRTYAGSLARAVCEKNFGDKVYLRGLIEFTNYCRNDCYYCGIRCGNRRAERYRLSEEEILACCRTGYGLGLRTFVLQGGDDPGSGDAWLTGVIATIRGEFPDCAITLSVGERPRQVYQEWYAAGADRYLLRHETAAPEHYGKLHPPALSLANRLRCLRDLREIGFQTGCGFMVGSPFQTLDDLAGDLVFIQDFQPHMVGIGPFIPHRDTPFAAYPAGDVELTLFLLALVRLMLPQVLLPATTALGTRETGGRERGILAGANVVMPNLSPADSRAKYLLYNDKLISHGEAAENREELEKQLNAIGRRGVAERGDHPDKMGSRPAMFPDID